MAYRITQGNYIEVVTKVIPQQYKPEGFYKQVETGKNQREIKQDLPRSYYVDFTGKGVDAFKIGWCADEVSPTYTQGNMTGGVFSANIYAITFAVRMDINRDIAGGQKNIGFAYFDDSEPVRELCGFSIACDPTDPSRWSAAIIRDTTAAPDKRKVTSISHESMVQEGELCAQPAEILLEALNSISVRRLLSNLWKKDGSVDSDQLDDIFKRLGVDKNIDDRDSKQLQFALYHERLKALALYAENSNNAYLLPIVNDLRARLADQDLFKEDNFKAADVALFEVETYKAKLEAFEAKLNVLGNPPTTDENKALITSGRALLRDIKSVLAHSAATTAKSDLSKISEILACSTIALENPQDKTNIDQLVTLADKASKKESKFWRKLGAGLLMFVGAVMMVAGFVAAVVTDSLIGSLGLVGTGTGTGALMVNKGYTLWQETKEKKGLHQSVSAFKEALGKVKLASEAPAVRAESPDSGVDEPHSSKTTP